MKTRATLLSITALCCCLTAVIASPARAKKAKRPGTVAKAEALATLSARVYALQRARLATGSAKAETLYRWSKRWLAAQSIAAKSKRGPLAAHLKRMQALQLNVSKQVAAGSVEAVEGLAAQYYVAEAELWLKMLKKKR